MKSQTKAKILLLFIVFSVSEVTYARWSRVLKEIGVGVAATAVYDGIINTIKAEPPSQQGFTTGSLMEYCGCWGPENFTSFPEPLCNSGYVVPETCPGRCGFNDVPYSFVCY